MEERTFIDKIDVSKLIENLEKCEVMDDARLMLNDFVLVHTGIEYSMEYEDTESGTAYRNSRSPQIIKDETLRVIDDYMRKRVVIDEASEATLNAGRKYIEKKGGICDDGTIISTFGDMRNNIKRVEAYIEAWRKEAAIKIEKDEPRLRPKQGTEKYVQMMFDNLKNKGYVSEDSSKKTWNYVCGVSDDTPTELITWNKGNFAMAVLVDKFFAPYNDSKNENKTYFEYNKQDAIQEFPSIVFS